MFEVHGVDLGPFGRRGDSGAVVFSETGRRAVGLLFGATTTGGANGAGVTYVCPLPAVLEALKIDLLV